MKPDHVAAIAIHLNAPYGPVVCAETVAAALRSGTFRNLACGDLERELLKTLFVECAPSLIGRACYQMGVDLEQAHNLYLELREDGCPVVYKWEDAVKDIVA